MQKIFLPLLFVMAFITRGKTQPRLFDQPVQLKNCNISVTANPFVATTVMELEFYNSRAQEVEAYQAFTLNNGQVISGFELELNGQYREGSIEERWKAVNAYNSIVGKRIDPAILQMNGLNNYSLRIYPVPANSSRRVKIIITQAMEVAAEKFVYKLPLDFRSVVDSVSVNIKVSNSGLLPQAEAGIIEKDLFAQQNGNYILGYQHTKVVLNTPVSFNIPARKNQPLLCVANSNDRNIFLLHYQPDINRYYSFQPSTVAVFWDVSLSGENRNLEKELLFLENYITVNKLKKVIITLFNQQVKATINYIPGEDNFSTIKNYLLNYKYTGATDYRQLDFAAAKTDAVLLFSDGYNSFGNSLPKTGAAQVNCIVSDNNYNTALIGQIAGTSGGRIINLQLLDINNAVEKIEQAENYLMACRSANGSVKVQQKLPAALDRVIFMQGEFENIDTLFLDYGNNGAINKTEKIVLANNNYCDSTTYHKLKMLKAYDSVVNNYNWQNMIVFGLTEKVITPQTAYLVLERFEDYIRYQIAPPKELEAKCAELNYVYKSQYKIQQLKTYTQQAALEDAAKIYNQRIKWWDSKAELIDITKPVVTAGTESKIVDNVVIAGTPTKSSNAATESVVISGVKTSNLQEVVVTSAMGVTRQARSTSNNAQIIKGEQLNIVRSANLNDALAGKVAGIQIRSQSAVALGRTGNVRLRGESEFGGGAGVLYVVDGTILPNSNDVNLDDINDITVLQGPSAAALFGPDGANGAIVITTKRARRTGYVNRWTEYTYNSTEDMEYLKQVKNAAASDKWTVFEELEEDNKKSAGFYFDMADYFFSIGYTEKAEDILYNGIEVCRGNTNGLKAAAYILESWKRFDEAINIYKAILETDKNNMHTRRDLALVYFQNKQYQQAVDEYYSIISKEQDYYYYNQIKEIALDEMNAVIALHKNELDLSAINPNCIRQLPVDLRITTESNQGRLYNTRIEEPNGDVCSINTPLTKNKGRIINAYDYYYPMSINEYAIKNARTGRYRLKIDSYDYESDGAGVIPHYVRVITFRNFQQPGQKLEIQNIIMDNQYGAIEIGSVDW